MSSDGDVKTFAVTARLRNFVEKAAQATLAGDAFDDAVTGQGLLNFFLRGSSVYCHWRKRKRPGSPSKNFKPGRS